MRGREHLSEAVVLSTCNRTEIYAVAEKFHGACATCATSCPSWPHRRPRTSATTSTSYYEDAAVAHLFAVASGLDSAVIGEAEILGQVRHAWEAARTRARRAPSLNLLFRHAVEVGKRARTETGIARGTTSVSQAAVAMAAERLARSRAAPSSCSAPATWARAWSARWLGAGRRRRAHRQPHLGPRRPTLAERLGGRAGRAGRPARARWREVDLLLTSTGAPPPARGGDLSRSCRPAHGRPLLIVDVAVPRDVDPACGRSTASRCSTWTTCGPSPRPAWPSGARSWPPSTPSSTRRSTGSSRRRRRRWRRSSTALHDRAEGVRTAELDRFRVRLAGLDERQREAVEALTRGIVAKLLHEPTVQLKEAAGHARGERLADALRDLFDL